MASIPSHLVTTHLTNPVYPVNKSTGFPILRSRTKVPLLKYSLALLHVLICFTTGHIAPGLQSFPITTPSGAAPHTPNFSAWQEIAHNGYVHFKIVMELDPPHSQLFSAQSKKNHYSSMYLLLKDGGMSFSWKQNLKQENFCIQRVMKNLRKAASALQQSPALALCCWPSPCHDSIQGLTWDFIKLWYSQPALPTPTQASSMVWVQSSIIRSWNACLFCHIS